MRSKIVVYGLGAAYEANESKILKNYNVVARCDKDLEKIKKFADGISRQYLQKHIDEYDKVLVVPDNVMGVVDDLTNNLNIPIEKICAFAYDNIKITQTEVQSLCNFYGEHIEDAILMLLLEKIRLPLEKTKYLEIGTNDPVICNNTFSLYERGARGVLVDPLANVALLSKMIRPEDEVITAAVAAISSRDKVPFFECTNSALSSLDQNHHLLWEESAIREKKMVSLIGINDLLAGLDFIPDILVVDAESEDENILRAIDYGRYQPKIIVVEVCHNAYHELINFMRNKGYNWYTTVKKVNAIFVLDEYTF